MLGNLRLQTVRNDDTRSTKAAARYADLAVLVDAIEREAGRRLSLRELTMALDAAGRTSPRGGVLTRTHAVRVRQAAAAMETSWR